LPFSLWAFAFVAPCGWAAWRCCWNRRLPPHRHPPTDLRLAAFHSPPAGVSPGTSLGARKPSVITVAGAAVQRPARPRPPRSLPYHAPPNRAPIPRVERKLWTFTMSPNMHPTRINSSCPHFRHLQRGPSPSPLPTTAARPALAVPFRIAAVPGRTAAAALRSPNRRTAIGCFAEGV